MDAHRVAVRPALGCYMPGSAWLGNATIATQPAYHFTSRKAIAWAICEKMAGRSVAVAAWK